MCGYSGFIYSTSSRLIQFDNQTENEIVQKKFLEAVQKIVHRGNEPLKCLFFPTVWLAHARLAFQDLSPQSQQPMTSVDGNWNLIFNGEIYNYQSLRKKIQDEFHYPFVSHGDSEVILAGFIHYREKILNLLEGEYSFCVFKSDGSEAFVARDPFGVKPLFVWCENISTQMFSVAKPAYQFQSSAFCFSSELKGMFCEKKWDTDGFLRQAVGLYEPIRTQFENIIEVPRGSALWVKKDSTNHFFNAELILDTKPIRALPFQNYHNSEKIYSDFHETLKDSVIERTVSDVELGVYLSGGIDSKTVAAYLSKTPSAKNHKYKTFTVGFDVEEGFDEAQSAVKFSHALGFDPYVCRVNYDDLSYAYPIAVYYSETVQPYTNGSAKWWLSKFASKHVPGVLTGDGGDELLCGYPSFRYAAWWKSIFKNRSGNNVFDQLKQNPLGENWRDHVYQKKFYEHAKNPWLSGSSHAGTGLDFVESLTMWGVAHPLFGEIKAIAQFLLGYEEARAWLSAQRESVSSWFKFGFSETDNFYTNPEHALFLWQNYFCNTHLPVQVLNWVGDRMEMANTLEGRPPFLSKKLKNFIYNLGDDFFVRGFEEKSILKRNFRKQFSNLASHIPVEKKQFNAPFLFSLNPQFHSERIYEKLKTNSLLDTVNVKALLHKMRTIDSLNEVEAHDPFMKHYLRTTIQMLVSFTYVDDYVKEGKKLERNSDYEDQIVFRTSVF